MNVDGSTLDSFAPAQVALLPPSPSLNQTHLRPVQVAPPGWQPLEALEPAAEPYRCTDPNAPHVVFVPGLGMDGLCFLRQLPLAVHAHLHLFQMPNEPAPGETGLGSFARHLEEYIRARGLEETPGGVHLAGSSMGGAVSLHTAVRGRIRLRGLILLGTFGNCRHLPLWQRLAAPLGWVLPHRGLQYLGRRYVSRIKFFGNLKPEEAEWLLTFRLQRTNPYFGRAIMALTRQNQIEAARGLKLPTLIVHGGCDYVLPHAAAVELSQAIPNAKLVTLEHSGHALFFTDHETVNQEIARFVRSVRGV